MSRVYFKESQKFNQWWIWLILLLVCGIWLWQLIQQVFMGIPFGDNPAPDFVIILIGLFPAFGFFLFKTLTLETEIDESGVYYRFKPFQRKPKKIQPDDILRYEVKKYNPILDYGGWGIRHTAFRKGSAYNVRGNMGVLFEFKSGKKFMLGTQNPEAIRSALNKLLKSPATGDPN